MKKCFKLFGLLAVMMALYSCNNEPEYCGQYQFSGTSETTNDIVGGPISQSVSGNFTLKQSGNTVTFTGDFNATGTISGNVITFEKQVIDNRSSIVGATCITHATCTIDPITVGGSSLKIRQETYAHQEIIDEYETDSTNTYIVVDVTATKIK